MARAQKVAGELIFELSVTFLGYCEINRIIDLKITHNKETERSSV